MKTGIITRTRRKLSCTACRSRRLKCDRAHPRCSRCVGRGMTSCVYLEHPSPLDRGHDSLSAKGFEATGDQSAGHLTTSVGGRSKYVGATFWACVGTAETVDDNVDEILRSQDPQLRIKYHSSRSDTADSNSGSRLKGEASSPHCSSTLLEDTRSEANSSTADHQPESLKQLLEALPSRWACDLLCKEYFEAVHGIIPIIHGPSFEKQYNRFWLSLEGMSSERIRTGILAENPGFLSLLFAVLFAASTTCSEAFLRLHFGNLPPEATSSRLYQLTEMTLSLVSFPRIPTLDSLSAFLISKNMVMREEDAMTTSSFVGIALRVAQGMGLHRDGSHFGLDRVKAEVRRHIWWYIIHTDVMTSIWCGLPAIWVDDGCHDTRMISDYVQIYQHDASTAAKNSEIQEDVRLIVAIGRYSITNLLRNLLRRQLAIKPFGMEDVSRWKEEIDSLDKQNEVRIACLERICAESNSVDTSIGEIKDDQHLSSTQELSLPLHLDPKVMKIFCNWGILLLRLMIQKAYCMLYQPLIRRPSGVLPQESLAELIRHCHSFIEIFLEMCINVSFQHYQWLYPGMYQALHPIAIILADLWNRPHSSEATTSRLLMDRVFSLLGPDGGVVTATDNSSTRRHLSTGGKKAWSVLYKMKRNAWVKAGLDPDVIWAAEPQQIQRTSDIDTPQNTQHKPEAELSPPMGFDSHPEILHDSVEHTMALAMTAPYPENLQSFDFVPTAGFSMPGYQPAEQVQNRRSDIFQGLDAVETENSLSEFAALIDGNPLEWHEWDFTAPSSDF